MVDDLSGVVELRGGFATVPSFEHDLFDGHLFEISAFDLAVEVVDIGGVVLAVMELKSSLFFVGGKGGNMVRNMKKKMSWGRVRL